MNYLKRILSKTAEIPKKEILSHEQIEQMCSTDESMQELIRKTLKETKELKEKSKTDES